MDFGSELQYLQALLHKLHIPSTLSEIGDLSFHSLDFGLRRAAGFLDEPPLPLREFAIRAKNDTIYRLTDLFLCNYIFFRVPAAEPAQVLVIGPYMSFSMTQERLLEDAERGIFSLNRIAQLEKAYENVPMLADDSMLFAVLNVFGERLWGKSENFSIIDAEQVFTLSPAELPQERETVSAETLALRMQTMEARYAFENELMLYVSKGMLHRAEKMFRGMDRIRIEQRIPDPIRNLKSFCIVCNTLLRKAAEAGGVHPLHLDKLSSSFAVRIESLHAAPALEACMLEMVRAYCRMVRKNAVQQFSPLIRRVILYIDSNLSDDLRLQHLSAVHKTNASYLSARFKEETGQTLTAFVSERRMELAMHLLQATQLQVQSIAQYCGIQDVNYFSKTFKKFCGLTPKQFRTQAGLRSGT